MQARLIGTIALIVFAVLVILTLAVFGPGAAGADTPPSPSPSPSVTADPEPEQASAALVRRALRMRDRAKVQRQKLARVRACFDARGPVRLYPKPRARAKADWQRALRRWTHQRDDWKAKVKAGVAKMRQPGGSGAARWWPAARYCGWPKHLKGWFCYVVNRESGGSPQAVNSWTRCWGLLQLHPCHWASKGVAWIRDVFNQLRLGWQLYRQAGASPWAL